MAVGDVGILLEASKRNHFPLVRVTKVSPSRDGNVQRLTLSDGKRLFHRGITNFSLLVPSEP